MWQKLKNESLKLQPIPRAPNGLAQIVAAIDHNLAIQQGTFYVPHFMANNLHDGEKACDWAGPLRGNRGLYASVKFAKSRSEATRNQTRDTTFHHKCC